jgi:hypothetical protein
LYNVHIPWQSQSDVFWTDLCAQVVEHFGLPGHRYTSHPEPDWMTFAFVNEQDHLMCKMLLSEHVAERNSWTLQVADDGTVTFPPEALAKAGWKEGDQLDWHDNGDRTWILTKKSV